MTSLDQVKITADSSVRLVFGSQENRYELADFFFDGDVSALYKDDSKAAEDRDTQKAGAA